MRASILFVAGLSATGLSATGLSVADLALARLRPAGGILGVARKIGRHVARHQSQHEHVDGGGADPAAEARRRVQCRARGQHVIDQEDAPPADDPGIRPEGERTLDIGGALLAVLAVLARGAARPQQEASSNPSSRFRAGIF